MGKRFATIWFRHLKTDWMIHRKPELKNVPFVLALPDHGRMRITEASAVAKTNGIQAGMVAADARVILPSLQIFNDKPGLSDILLKKICAWCIRYTPATATDPPDGLMLDITAVPIYGAAKNPIIKRNYHKTEQLWLSCACCNSRYYWCCMGRMQVREIKCYHKPGEQADALKSLPPSALRLDIQFLRFYTNLGYTRLVVL
jgi:protein ImuB